MAGLPLLSQEFLRKLDNLSLISRNLHRRGQQGVQTSYRKGASLEFREYRPYQAGDDLRFIDWNVWERLGKLLVKIFTAEEDRTVYLLVDSSGSMGAGNPTKLQFAAEVAAALAYIAGRNQDRVGIVSLGETVKAYRRPMKGSGTLLESFRFLEELTPEGPTGFSAACRQFAGGIDRTGIAVVLTDLLDPTGYREGIKQLLYRRFEVILIHILGDEDLSPGLSGPLLLKDREGDRVLKLTVDDDVKRAYQKRLEDFITGARQFCLANGVEYLQTANSVPFEDLVLKYLRQGLYLR